MKVFNCAFFLLGSATAMAAPNVVAKNVQPIAQVTHQLTAEQILVETTRRPEFIERLKQELALYKANPNDKQIYEKLAADAKTLGQFLGQMHGRIQQVESSTAEELKKIKVEGLAASTEADILAVATQKILLGNIVKEISNQQQRDFGLPASPTSTSYYSMIGFMDSPSKKEIADLGEELASEHFSKISTVRRDQLIQNSYKQYQAAGFQRAHQEALNEAQKTSRQDYEAALKNIKLDSKTQKSGGPLASRLFENGDDLRSMSHYQPVAPFNQPELDAIFKSGYDASFRQQLANPIDPAYRGLIQESLRVWKGYEYSKSLNLSSIPSPSNTETETNFLNAYQTKLAQLLKTITTQLNTGEIEKDAYKLTFGADLVKTKKAKLLKTKLDNLAANLEARVTQIKIEEEITDGMITPGESLSVSFVIENYSSVSATVGLNFSVACNPLCNEAASTNNISVALTPQSSTLVERAFVFYTKNDLSLINQVQMVEVSWPGVNAPPVSQKLRLPIKSPLTISGFTSSGGKALLTGTPNLFSVEVENTLGVPLSQLSYAWSAYLGSTPEPSITFKPVQTPPTLNSKSAKNVLQFEIVAPDQIAYQPVTLKLEISNSKGKLSESTLPYGSFIESKIHQVTSPGAFFLVDSDGGVADAKAFYGQMGRLDFNFADLRAKTISNQTLQNHIEKMAREKKPIYDLTTSAESLTQVKQMVLGLKASAMTKKDNLSIAWIRVLGTSNLLLSKEIASLGLTTETHYPKLTSYYFSLTQNSYASITESNPSFLLEIQLDSGSGLLKKLYSYLERVEKMLTQPISSQMDELVKTRAPLVKSNDDGLNIAPIYFLYELQTEMISDANLNGDLFTGGRDTTTKLYQFAAYYSKLPPDQRRYFLNFYQPLEQTRVKLANRKSGLYISSREAVIENILKPLARDFEALYPKDFFILKPQSRPDR